MSIKKNFLQALNEVADPQGQVDRPETGSDAVAAPATPAVPAPPGSHRPSEMAAAKPQEAAARTIITRETRIDGSVTTGSQLDIAGTIVGDVRCEEAVRITGQVEGNVFAQSVEMSGSRIHGDVTVKTRAFIRAGAVLVGNLTAVDAEVDGKVKGDIQTEGSLQVLPEARIQGDIRTRGLEVSKGALLQGIVNILPEDGSPDPFAER